MSQVGTVEAPATGRAPQLDELKAHLRRAAPLALALAGFAAAWSLLGALESAGFYGNLVIRDTPVYLDFGDAVVRGGVPDRDAPLEYPPLAIPILLLPYALGVAPGDIGAYTAVFEQLMLVCGLAAVVFVYLSLRELRIEGTRCVLALALIVASPVLIGPVLLTRYDLWPAALTAAALWLALRGHPRLAGAGLALAAMAKVYAIVILPLLVLWVWRTRGRAEALRTAGVALGVGLLGLAPFLLIAPEGIVDALARQFGRPLQLESLGSALLMVLNPVANLDLRVETSFGSQNLGGPWAEALATASSVLQVAALAAVWVWFARGAPVARRFVLAAVAAVAAYVAFGKVLSPQYVIWLVPLVPLVGGRRGLAAASALVLAMILTQAYFPRDYFLLAEALDPGVATTVLLRNLSLTAVFVALVLPREPLLSLAEGLRRRVRSADVIGNLAARPGQVLAVVLVGAALLRLVWLALPEGSLIFDETYYVNAARVILGWPVPADAPYADAIAGLDPNAEHPPLGKVGIAASMALFGDNGLGWRLPSVVAGMVSLAALYGIVRATGGTAWLGVLAVGILALDNLTFVHARIGTLDMLALAPALVGAWLGLRNRPIAAGVAFAIAGLIKATAIFGLLAFAAVALLPLIERYRRGDRIVAAELRPLALGLAAAAVVGIAGLWLLDLRFTAFENPFQHAASMFGYGISLTGGPGPGGIASNPWEWLVNGGGFDYFRVDVNAVVNGEVVASNPTIHFQAALNPVLIGMAPLVAGFGLWLALRGNATARWALIWGAANYLPFFVLVLLAHRITYFYYVLPVVPALAALTAVFLIRARIPRLAGAVYLVALGLAFIAYFPFRQVP